MSYGGYFNPSSDRAGAYHTAQWTPRGHRSGQWATQPFAAPQYWDWNSEEQAFPSYASHDRGPHSKVPTYEYMSKFQDRFIPPGWRQSEGVKIDVYLDELRKWELRNGDETRRSKCLALEDRLTGVLREVVSECNKTVTVPPTPSRPAVEAVLDSSGTVLVEAQPAVSQGPDCWERILEAIQNSFQDEAFNIGFRKMDAFYAFKRTSSDVKSFIQQWKNRFSEAALPCAEGGGGLELNQRGKAYWFLRNGRFDREQRMWLLGAENVRNNQDKFNEILVHAQTMPDDLQRKAFFFCPDYGDWDPSCEFYTDEEWQEFYSAEAIYDEHGEFSYLQTQELLDAEDEMYYTEQSYGQWNPSYSSMSSEPYAEAYLAAGWRPPKSYVTDEGSDDSIGAGTDAGTEDDTSEVDTKKADAWLAAQALRRAKGTPKKRKFFKRKRSFPEFSQDLEVHSSSSPDAFWKGKGKRKGRSKKGKRHFYDAEEAPSSDFYGKGKKSRRKGSGKGKRSSKGKFGPQSGKGPDFSGPPAFTARRAGIRSFWESGARPTEQYGWY